MAALHHWHHIHHHLAQTLNGGPARTAVLPGPTSVPLRRPDRRGPRLLVQGWNTAPPTPGGPTEPTEGGCVGQSSGPALGGILKIRAQLHLRTTSPPYGLAHPAAIVSLVSESCPAQRARQAPLDLLVHPGRLLRPGYRVHPVPRPVSRGLRVGLAQPARPGRLYHLVLHVLPILPGQARPTSTGFAGVIRRGPDDASCLSAKACSPSGVARIQFP